MHGTLHGLLKNVLFFPAILAHCRCHLEWSLLPDSAHFVARKPKKGEHDAELFLLRLIQSKTGARQRRTTQRTRQAGMITPGTLVETEGGKKRWQKQ